MLENIRIFASILTWERLITIAVFLYFAYFCWNRTNEQINDNKPLNLADVINICLLLRILEILFDKNFVVK